MDVDPAPAAPAKGKGRAKEDGKEGKQKFEVKKVPFVILLVQIRVDH